jgi:hypothetical protein
MLEFALPLSRTTFTPNSGQLTYVRAHPVASLPGTWLDRQARVVSPQARDGRLSYMQSKSYSSISMISIMKHLTCIVAYAGMVWYVNYTTRG